MDDNNKLPKQAKPQEFELVELLFQEYIRSNIASLNIEYSFQARFQSFINQIPSYLHSSSKIGFFTHFFFGSFATLLDTKLGEKLGVKKLQYSFNTIDNLRIAAETNAKTHIFIFTEYSSKNNKKQKQDKNKELAFTKLEWQQLKGRKYTDADNDTLEISVIKINKSKGSIKVIVEKQDIKDSSNNIKQYHDFTKQCVDENSHHIYLEDEISKFAHSKTRALQDSLKFILDYIKQIHDYYQNIPYGDGAQEADQHGFVAGIFNNFRYRENAHVYLEQFAGRGYADIVLLVRGADRATKSIPIIIELKAGTSIGTTSAEALKQVLDYTQGFQPNNMRILSLADNILCVGMNLDHNVNSFIQMQLVQRQSKVIPVIQSIITRIIENDFTNQNLKKDDLIAIQNQIKVLLENTYQTFPGVGEKSSAHYYSRFIIGQSFLLQDYDKHIFVYDKDEYIATKTVIDQHATRLNDGSTTKKKKIEKIIDDSNAVTSILFIPISSSKDPAIILNIIDANREIELKNIPLDNALIGNRKVVKLNIKFNINKSFKEYCDIELSQFYNSALEYNSAQAPEQASGNFKLVDATISDNLIDNISEAIDSQQGLIISESKYKELFAKIGEVIYPVKSLINSESEFQGILEGIFKYYSDLKLSQQLDRRELVLTEFQTGGGSRIDMLVQAIGSSEQGMKEYIPVGLELKYDDSVKLNSFDKKQDEYIQGLILAHKEQVLVKELLADQIERYAQGAAIKTITDGNKVAIMGIVFNKQAQDHNSLLLTTERFFEANIVHSSKLYTTSVNIDVPSINDLPKPDSDGFIPDWVERDTLNLIAKAETDDDSSMWYLSNSLLDNQKIQELQNLLQKDKQLAQYIDGLDLSFNSVTASSVKELIKQLRRLVYLDLSDNDLANNNLLDLKEIIEDIQVPILKIADIGMNDEQMGKIFKSLAENDKISDLDITHLEDDNNLIMSQDTASKIAQYLKSTRMLNYLNIAHNKIDDVAMSIIAQGLKGQSTLSSLVLTENSIGTQGTKALGEVLKDTTISNIDLSGNPLGILGVQAIVAGLKDADNIESIVLVNVALKYNRYDRDTSRKLLSSISSLFQNQHLTKINIAENNIGNGALSKIFRILSTRGEKSNLQDLSLAGNTIDWGAHQATINTLKSYMYDFISTSKKIRSLDLAFMSIDDDLGQAIAQALEKNVSLINLDFGGNYLIGNKTVQGLANVLKTHQYLKYLNLSDNKLSITDIRLILEAIKMNQVVSHINLSGNDFSGIIIDADGKQIMDLDHQDIDFMNLLKGNKELKYLNLAKCQLSQKSLLSLFKAIENNMSLEVLDIRDNKIESSIIDNILRSLEKNANQGLEIGLKVLHISKGVLDRSVISKLMDKSLGISVLVDDDVLPSDSLDERLEQVCQIDPVDKKEPLEVDRESQTFERETVKGHYHYWLQAHDILDIARVHYGYDNRAIEIVGSISQLSREITQYLSNGNNSGAFTMILNIGESGAGGNHWVSLVLNRVGSSNYGYYIDSVGNSIAGNVVNIFNQHGILIHDFNTRQQIDGYNCGLWALENSRRICEIVEENRAVSKEDIRNSLVRSRSEEEFEEMRDNILRELLNDNQRRVNLENMGLAQVEMPQDAIVANKARKVNILDEDLQHSIVATCLSRTSKSKRSINECKIGWSDVDEISISKTRKSKEIVIDSKKFLAYSKKNIGDEQKSWQLVRLAQEIQNKGGQKILGEYKGLFDRVIEAGGYKNYIQQERIKEVGLSVINRDEHNISPELKLKLINAVGKVQLIRGIHSTIVSCQDGSTSSCALSVSGIGYSFLSQPIENMMVKVAPKMVGNAVGVTSKLAPKVLSYDTKFILQTLGVKYGVKIAKGGASAIASIFDIADIGISSNILIECNKRADSNPCSDKEIRDNIASITFSSVSFISGVGLTAVGAGPAAIVVGAIIMVGQGIYNGISNIIEYEKKYDTTHGENWSIFLRTFLLQRMSEDVEHLEFRHATVYNITQQAWQRLYKSPESIVAYATGLGKEELTRFKECERKLAYGVPGGPHPYTSCKEYTRYNIISSSSKIDMSSHSAANTNKLSRVLPNPIKNATLVCLPKITDADYEKGIVQSRPNAIYECDNAVVMVHNHRKDLSVKEKYIVYDLRYVNAGTIIGSQELNNIFKIFGGNALIFGSSNLTNIFMVLDDKYYGKVYLDNNSTNIIDVSKLPNDLISMEYTHVYPLTMNISITANNARISQVYSKSKDNEIRYIGRKNKVDKIICKQLLYRDHKTVNDNEVEHNHIVIDSGGGEHYYSSYNYDQIQNCNKVIISPNTVVQGSKGNYTIYIKSLDYAAHYKANYATSEIDIAAGRGTIVFPEISLLKDTIEIKSLPNNSLSIIMPLGHNAQYELVLRNYLNENKNTNYALIDKYGNNIFILDGENTAIKKIVLYLECNFDTVADVVKHYRNIKYSKEDYVVFSIVKNRQYNNFLKFGSSKRDIIIINKDVVYVEGSDGSDLYIIDNNIDYPVNVNNKAADLQLDVLKLPVNNINDLFLIEDTNNLHLLFNKRDEVEDTKYQGIPQEVIIENYWQGKIYQHIAIMDRNNNSYIAFKQNDAKTLLPFYHASLERNIFILSPNSKAVVIDIDINNIILHKQGSDLLLTEKKASSFNVLNIILRDYYKDQKQWLAMKIYSYNNRGISNIIDLNNIQISAISYQEQYDHVIKEYVVDLTNRSYYIQHNHNSYYNGKLVNYPVEVESRNETIGVVIFKNTPFKRLVVIDHENHIFRDNLYNDGNHSLIIENWTTNSKYQMSMFEFDTGLNQERIPVLNDTIARIKLNNALDMQIKKIDINVVKAVIDFLKLSCTKYNKQGNLSEKLRYNFLEEELNYRIGDSNNQDYSLKEVREYLSSGNDIAGAGLLWLMFKSYNELLIKYPYIRSKDLHKIDDSCFQTVLSYSKIKMMIDNLNDSINDNTSFSSTVQNIEQFINSNKKEVQQVIKQLAELDSTNIVDIAENNHHKHRHHHGESTNEAGHHVDNKHIQGYHRVRRDIEEELQIAKDRNDNNDVIGVSVGDDAVMSSSSGSSVKPIGYNMIEWIKDNIWASINLNPIERIKNLLNIDDVKEQVKIRDIDVSDNIGYVNNKNQQDDLVKKLSIIRTMEAQIVELEEKKIEETKLLKAMQQKLNTIGRDYQYKYDKQQEYEEELSNSLLTLQIRKVEIQKQDAKIAQIVIIKEINNEIEKIKQAIQANEQLNSDYFHAIATVKEMVLHGEITELFYEDCIRYLGPKIKYCEEEDIRLTNALQELEQQQEEYYTYNTLESIVEEKNLPKIEALNTQQKKILQEDEELKSIFSSNQDQKQAVYRINDQIKLQKSKIESLSKKLDELHDSLAILYTSDSNLAGHKELSYWDETIDAKNDTAYQVSRGVNNSLNLTNLSNGFIGNNTYQDQIFDYNSLGFQGNLLLLNLLMHKKNGVKYNHGNKSIIINDLNTEYAQSLAYNAYAPYRAENEADIELLGAS